MERSTGKVLRSATGTAGGAVRARAADGGTGRRAPGGSPQVRVLLARADAELVAATLASDPGERFVHGHLAALRAGAALVEATGVPRRRPAPRTVWDMVELVAPALADRSAWFASAATVRAGVESGRGVVDDVAADDHVAAAEDFVDAVRSELDLVEDPSLERAS